MSSNRRMPTLCALLALGGATAASAQPPEEAAAQDAGSSAVALGELLEGVAARSERTFVVDRRAPESVEVTGADAADLDYAGLLAVLRSNGLGAAEIQGYVHIVPSGDIRAYPLPIVDADDEGVLDEEWVTSVIDVDENLEAAMLVPVLRPLLPRDAHFAAMASANKLVVVSRFGNLRRIRAVIDAML